MKTRLNQQRESESKALIQVGYRHYCCVKADRSESPKHRNAKWRMANWHWDHLQPFFTEAKWTNGSGEGDFLNPRWQVDFELTDSEDMKSIIEKVAKGYPFPIVPVPVDTPALYVEKMLQEFEDTNGGCWEFYAKRHGLLIEQKARF